MTIPLWTRTLFPYTTLFRSEQGNEATVERGVEGTKAAEHRVGTELFQGPILPPTDPLTGETGTPPTGAIAISIGDNLDRKSTRLNSSHVAISYAVFGLKKKN